MLTLPYWFAKGVLRMRARSICVALLLLGGITGCQKREPTRPAQPTVEPAKGGSWPSEQKRCRSAGIAGFAECVRRGHFDLP
jgi:hypothetical protein